MFSNLEFEPTLWVLYELRAPKSSDEVFENLTNRGVQAGSGPRNVMVTHFMKLRKMNLIKLAKVEGKKHYYVTTFLGGRLLSLLDELYRTREVESEEAKAIAYAREIEEKADFLARLYVKRRRIDEEDSDVLKDLIDAELITVTNGFYEITEAGKLAHRQNIGNYAQNRVEKILIENLASGRIESWKGLIGSVAGIAAVAGALIGVKYLGPVIYGLVKPSQEFTPTYPVVIFLVFLGVLFSLILDSRK